MPSLLRRALIWWTVLVAGPTASAAQPGLDIVPVANAGVMLRCGTTAVLVDALFREGVDGYETIEASTREALETGRAPFDGVVLVLATHNHRDHFDAAAVARHLRANRQAEFWGTPQTAGAVSRLQTERVRTLNRSATRAFEGGRVTFFAVPHNAPHRMAIEHTSILVDLCGRNVLFSGDAELAVSDFEPIRRAAPRIDAAVVPWWFLTSRAGREVVDRILRPSAIWAAHGDLAEPATWMASVRANYPAANIAFSRR
jgi:L-ascorbate metabolism protein UlaG (beta-lactamase superfamily)